MANKLFIAVVLLVALAASAQAKSACEEHKDREAKNTGPMKLDVKCLPNGDYAPLQCFPGNKFCYCASPSGDQVTSPSRNRKFCSCDLKKYEVDKKLNKNGRPIDPPSGTWVPKCQRDGLYYGKQCESGTNICWCVNQDGAQSSKEKKVGITCS
ncbi:Nidogen-2 [Tyrophagus putrescentiae]|nr:Nidogen-2 [Tyrophagus putrescentiae]